MIQAYAAAEAGGKLEPIEYDPGELSAHEVEIDIDYCGVCHSDVSMHHNEWGMTQYPYVGGHEIIGKVAAIGSSVTNLQPGQPVGLGWHAGYCEACTQCGTGNHNLCAGAEATIIGHYGGFANKVRASATATIPLPEGIDLESAGPLFCGGITVFNPLVQYNIQPTDQVAVIGIGGLGHMALQFLNAWGCRVTAFTSSDAKREEALEMGAHQTLNSRDEKEIEQSAGRFDLLISTVNVKLDWNKYLNTLSPKGRLHFVGATLEPLDIGVFNLIMGQRSISGSPVGSPDTIRKMLDFAVLHEVQPVIEKFQFSEINEAMERVHSGKAHYRVVLHH